MLSALRSSPSCRTAFAVGALLFACGSTSSPPTEAVPSEEQAAPRAPTADAVSASPDTSAWAQLDVPPLQDIAAESWGTCGFDDDGVYCWRSHPGSELFRPPRRVVEGRPLAIAVQRGLYVLDAAGELTFHDHDSETRLGQVELPGEGPVVMRAAVWRPNRAREVVCVEAGELWCFQLSASLPANYPIHQVRLTGATRWAVGPRVALQLSSGSIRTMKGWPDEWIDRNDWPLVTLEGRSNPEPLDLQLDPAPLRRGQATLVESEGSDFLVVTPAGTFECGYIGTNRYHPDEFACVEHLALPPDVSSAHDGLYVVRQAEAGLVDLVDRAGTPLFTGARRFAFEGNTIYALEPDGRVRFVSRADL